MSEHTPGPWVAQEGDYGWAIFQEDTMRFVTTVTGIHATEANARLIAAALDLLEEHTRWAEAFGNALSLARGGDYSGVDALARDTDINAPMTAPVIASAAIAKAEGRGA